ncbi:transcriptional regulator [Aquamicrobium defluvii]|uniref:Transcriptional regulator n=2 Tax=Aquamicrobium defluvii TaxID=69279 RepID=A0A4R6YF74_9HYPH|nr:transcriptional regulator [Aquamicrobium defluvii]
MRLQRAYVTLKMRLIDRSIDRSLAYDLTPRLPIIALKSIQGKHSFRYSWNAGYRMPAHSITGGICLLSRMTDDEVRALYKDQFNAFYPRAPQSLDELLEVLQQVRGQGWIELDMSSVSDVRAIGVSIASADGKEAYGYSLSFPAGSLSSAGAMEVRDHLVRSAQELGSQFGDRFWTRMEVA